MIQPYVVAAAIAVMGGIVAISARDARVVVVGLLLAMCAAQLAASPEPVVLAVVFRILGSLLAAYLLWAAARGRSIDAEGSGMGFLAECTVAAAAFSAGWFVAPVKPLAGPLVAQAAGIALIAISIVPLTGRDLLRVGAGATILVLGGSMLLAAWVGQPSSLWYISLTALLVGLVGATSLLISPTAAEATTIPVAAMDADTAATGGAEVTAVALEAPAARRGGRKAKVAAVDVTAALAASADPAEVETATDLPEPIPAVPGPARVRISKIRNAAARSLRGGAPTDRPAGAGAIEEPATRLPDRPEPPPASRVRRLRPREPRK